MVLLPRGGQGSAHLRAEGPAFLSGLQHMTTCLGGAMGGGGEASPVTPTDTRLFEAGGSRKCFYVSSLWPYWPGCAIREGLVRRSAGAGGRACSFIGPSSPLLLLPHTLACDAVEFCAAAVLGSGMVSGDPSPAEHRDHLHRLSLGTSPQLDQTPWNPRQQPSPSAPLPRSLSPCTPAAAGAQRTTLRSRGSPRPARWCLTSRCLFWTRSKCCSSSR